MRAHYTFWPILVCLLSLLASSTTYATHVRAGEITTRRISPDRLTYEITLTAYFDEVGGVDAANRADEVDFCLGDGTTLKVRRLPRIYINNRTTSINIYRFQYTYGSTGTYQISANIVNRNDNTINLRQPSRDIPFWIRTTIQVNAFLGLNATPILLNPPLDSARVGQKFCHNPAAFDIDGDSLAYRMAIPQESAANICRGFDVVGYRDPARGINPNAQNEATNGPATLTITPLTGDLCWDSPAVAGQYNIAFIIEEWRDGVLIGEIVRDMQIIVTDTRNNRPQIDPLPDLCREAGSLIQVPLRAFDPDGHRIEISAYGGIFNRTPDGSLYNPSIVAPPFATLTPPSGPQSGTATATIRWQTSCAHARTEEYDILARVVDLPPRPAIQLATLQSFRIRIIAPRPTGLVARPQVVNNARAIRLSWTDYTCAPSSNTASVMGVYRAEGCPTLSGTCTTGLSTTTGYTLIGTVPLGTTTFTDTTALRRGVRYSYRLVARFAPLPLGGESVPSDGVCLELPLLAPLITNVTVDSTDALRGQITLRWTRPIGLNPADGGSPFQYRVFRATGITGTAFTQITAISSTLSPTAPDTVFVDRGLNTDANAYRYRIDFYQTTNGQLTRVDATEAAASPRLSINAALRQLELVWATNTPWSNDNQEHRVYQSRRGRNQPLTLIAQVRVQQQPYRYVDNGSRTLAGVQSLSLSVDTSYCYRVETVGRYTSTSALGGLLLRNFSQIVCASPADTARPCPPLLRLDSLDCSPQSVAALCNQTSFANNLRWTNPARDSRGGVCDPTVVSYNVYFSGQAGPPFSRIGSPSVASFQHQNLTSVVGCYYVTAVNRRGAESAPSNTVCQDVCRLFVLPNVFTPNGDGINEVFTPKAGCAGSVRSVSTVIYNRWGGQVWSGTDPAINWSGVSSGGSALPSGLYYYEVSVVFGGLDANPAPVVFKGWVQLFREANVNGG